MASRSSVSSYTNPKINDDGSVDVFFSPESRRCNQLGQDGSGERLVPNFPLLQSGRSVLRQKLGPQRHRRELIS